MRFPVVLPEFILESSIIFAWQIALVIAGSSSCNMLWNQHSLPHEENKAQRLTMRTQATKDDEYDWIKPYEKPLVVTESVLARIFFFLRL